MASKRELLLFSAAFLAFSFFDGSFGAESTLRFLSIVHRHGNRAPMKTYPLDPYKNDSYYWPEGREELLKIGKVNMFRMGEYLRDRYDEFLPAKYQASEVFVRSSFKNRAMMSAELLLAGLFPPVEKQIWKPHLLWQPIPVVMLDKTEDDMLCVAKPCPRLSKEYDIFINSSYKALVEANREIMNYLQNYTGLNFDSDKDIITVLDNLYIEERQGLELPEWTKSVYPERILTIFQNLDSGFRGNPTITKLFSGVLINDILSNMLRKRHEKGNYKRLLNLYSAHDTTIGALWRGMGIVQKMPHPDYGALFIVELHEIGDKYFVRVLYKGSTEDDTVILNAKDCAIDQEPYKEGLCDLDVLNYFLQSIIITDFDRECFSVSGPGRLAPPTQC